MYLIPCDGSLSGFYLLLHKLVMRRLGSTTSKRWWQISQTLLKRNGLEQRITLPQLQSEFTSNVSFFSLAIWLRQTKGHTLPSVHCSAWVTKPLTRCKAPNIHLAVIGSQSPHNVPSPSPPYSVLTRWKDRVWIFISMWKI